MADPVYKPDARRDADAAVIADGAGQWLHITLREPMGAFRQGEHFYGIPSSKNDGSYYTTNLRFCSCRDYENRGQGCKHQRAAALHAAKVRAVRIFERSKQQAEGSAEEADPTPAPIREVRGRYADLFPGCAAGCGELVERKGERCHHCLAQQTYDLDRESKRAVVAMGV